MCVCTYHTIHTHTHHTFCTHAHMCVHEEVLLQPAAVDEGNSKARRLGSEVSLLEELPSYGGCTTWTHALCSPQAYLPVLNVQTFFPLLLLWPIPPHPSRFSSDATSPRKPSQNPLLDVRPYSPLNTHPYDTYHTIPKFPSQGEGDLSVSLLFPKT